MNKATPIWFSLGFFVLFVVTVGHLYKKVGQARKVADNAQNAIDHM